MSQLGYWYVISTNTHRTFCLWVPSTMPTNEVVTRANKAIFDVFGGCNTYFSVYSAGTPRHFKPASVMGHLDLTHLIKGAPQLKMRMKLKSRDKP